jgi:WS/DGAT/MGAT family acyltransferase
VGRAAELRKGDDLMGEGDAPLEWGSGTELNAFEVLMWRAESDRSLSSTICMLEELDARPDWDRFVAAHDWATRMVPRFRQRIVEPPLGLGAPRWTADEDFDLRYHLRRYSVPGDGGWDELLQVVTALAMTPFDRNRPTWEAVLIEGLPDGKVAYLLKMHHIMTDGLGAMRLLGNLHSGRRGPSTDKPQPPPSEQRAATPFDALVEQVRSDIGAVPGFLGSAGSTVLSAVRDPKGALRYGQSLRRVLTPPPTTGSPLLARRGLAWHLAALDVSMADLKAAGKAAGGSLNDAFLAALLGGYRRYHESMGASVPATIPVAIPVSVRKAGDPEGGNRISSARLAAPLAERDPVRRVVDVRAQVLSAKGEVAGDIVGTFSPALARLPGVLIAPLVGQMTKGNDLQASNVPGLQGEVFLAGAKVERMYGMGPLPGCAAMISIISHGPVGCVGINLDPAAFTEPRLFVDSLVEGFAEVLELCPGSTVPVARR